MAGLTLSACQQKLKMKTPGAKLANATATLRPTSTRTPAPTQTPRPTATFAVSQIPDLITQDEIDFLASHEVKEGDISRPVMMMTYDDNAKYSDIRTILDAFNAYNMKASFFFIGEKIRLSSKAVRAIVEDGHLLGCHGYAHNNFMTLSNDQINRRLEKSFAAVEEVVPGYRMRFIRLPYGSGVGSERILRVVAEWGLQHIYWSTGSNGLLKGAHDTVLRNAKNGAIVLSHMFRQFDVEQAGEIVASLVEKGFSLETVETGRKPEDIFEK